MRRTRDDTTKLAAASERASAKHSALCWCKETRTTADSASNSRSEAASVLVVAGVAMLRGCCDDDALELVCSPAYTYALSVARQLELRRANAVRDDDVMMMEIAVCACV